MNAARQLPSPPPADAPVHLSAQLFEAFRALAYAQAGIEIKNGKEALVASRIGSRIRALSLDSPAAYLEHLRAAPAGPEMVQFLDVITTNVTSFFREPGHFTRLGEHLRRRRDAGQRRFRLWSAASSSGEEVYTMAMVTADVLGFDVDWRILGTDISTRVLRTARAGCYGPRNVEPIPSELRARFLTRAEAGTFRVTDALRARTAFTRMNLSTPPFPMKGPLDAVFCRNVMIYFDVKVRTALVHEVERLLDPGGLLMIGHAESLIDIDTGLRAKGAAVYEKP